MPSKSNRNRTSSSPARPSRARSRFGPRRRTSGSRRRRRRPACRRSRRCACRARTSRRSAALLIAAERRFLCSQCSCISSPNSSRSPPLERRLTPQAELLDEVQVARPSPRRCSACASSWSLRMLPALREKPVKNSSRLSSRLNSVSIADLSGRASTLSSRLEREAGDAAEGGDVLVLLADRLAEAVDLDVAGLLGQLAADAAGVADARTAP